MIPRLHSRGTSFKETLNYVLHDVGGQSADRVAWSITQNLFSAVDGAWFEMFETFKDQNRLKAAAGIDARGRKNTAPVLHYTLSWSPTERPSAEEMQAAAISSLKALGLSGHEAVIAGHDEKDHLHVHIVVNTVHPETGRTATLKFSKLDLSRWAEAYEREHGIFCETRIQNNEDRRILGEQRSSEAHDILKSVADGRDPGDRAPYVAVKDHSPDRRTWLEQKTAQRQREKMAEEILSKLTAHDSTFARVQIAKEVNLRTKNKESFDRLLAVIESNPELVQLPNATDRYSTKTLVAAEAQIASLSVELAGRRDFGVGASDLSQVSDLKLSEEQARALTHITGPSALACVVGYAGTGKSTMLGSARARWEREGYAVRGATISGVAAQGLEDGSGIKSETIHRLLWSIENDKTQLTNRDVLVIDEAGMVGSLQMRALLSAVKSAGAKLVLVGDPEQLRAIQAGAAFRAVVDRAGAATMTDVRRQRIQWQREATLDLAEGRVTRALAAYEQGGHVKGFAEKFDAVEAMVRDWSAGQETLLPGQSSIMLAGTNATVDTLNRRVRDSLKDKGLLGQEKILLSVFETINKPREEFELDIAVGDRLMFTKNDYKLDVRNGTLGRIVGYRNNVLLMTIEGQQPRTIEVDLTTYRNFQYGYAMTVHKAQGVTVNQTLVLAERNMDSNLAYVALSRHKDNVSLYWAQDEIGDRSKLDRLMARERVKDTTLDYIEPRTPIARPSVSAPGLDKSLSRDFSRAVARAPSRSETLKAEMGAWRGKRGNRGRGFGREL